MKEKMKLIFLLFLVVIFSCEKKGRLDHMFNDKDATPENVENIEITSKPGGALVTYSLPDDRNILYVEADYQVRPGKMRKVKSSRYGDTLRLEGFGDTLQHDVDIYSVSKGEKKSKPIRLTVSGLTPPVISVRDSIGMKSTFGGVMVNFKNSAAAPLAFELLLDTTGHGDWKNLETFHSGAIDGSFSARGLDSTRQRFGAFVRDRWGNRSDTLVENLSPLFEEFIPKSTWSILPLETDKPGVSGRDVDKLWDEDYGSDGLYVSSHSDGLPSWFTIDLGVKVSISRMLMHMYQGESGQEYAGGAVKELELYGSNDPDADGGWDNWELLGKFKTFKPSGLPGTQKTADDVEYAVAHGVEYNMDGILPAYRYIRFKTLDTYSGDAQVVIAELDFYGEIQP